MKKMLIGWFLLLATEVACAATSGSCEKNAVSIASGQMKTVILVPEYDPDFGETMDDGSGVFYFKATLSKGMSYTVWTEGGTEDLPISIDCYAKEGDNEPWAGFDSLDEVGGNVREVMYSDSWDEEDPKSWTFYFELMGDAGQRVNITFSTGVRVPPGREDSPRSIKPATAPNKVTANMELGGEYYFITSMTADRRYAFATEGGATNRLLNIEIKPYKEETEMPAIYEREEYISSSDSGYYVVPVETANYLVIVSAGDPEDYNPFSLTYALAGERKIADHAATELNAANAYTATYTAGYKNAPSTGAFDEIIDEQLFKFTAVKDQSYFVKTADSTENLILRIYDSKGNILGENYCVTPDSYDAAYGFTATAAGVYYIGVCENLENEFVDKPSYSKGTLTLTTIHSEVGSPDPWDDADDTTAGASGLVPMPGKAGDAPQLVDAEGHGWHQLNETDWADVFVIAARKDVTYAIATSLEDESAMRNNLKAELFQLSGKVEKPIAFAGSIGPGEAEPLTFTATANATYYLRLSVDEGAGLTYPNYKVHTLAYSTKGADLGILQVNAKGATSTWSLDSESVKYPSGASVLVSGKHTVKFTAATGFKLAKASETVTVNPGSEPTIVTAVYSDTFDPKDDTEKGASVMSLKATATSYARTLWKEDAADFFTFTAKAGQYYDFALKGTGDSVFDIYDTKGQYYATAETSVSQLNLPAGKCYLRVSHAIPVFAEDSVYTLSGFVANVGSIALSAKTLNVREGAATATLQVKRTAKDGRVRVKYGTVAGTAKPGQDYVAQNGILEWAANDNAAKTITIKMIPELVNIYQGNRTFDVVLKALEPDERDADEYPADITIDTCTITITETARAGTTAETVYAAKAPKLATVKTETVSLSTGTFFGVLTEDGVSVTNGAASLASVTFTASTAAKAALSAKVMVAGKTYQFKATGWDYQDEEICESMMTLAQKVAGEEYESTLSIRVTNGRTDDGTSWKEAGAEVELVLNVADAKGVQEGVVYRGNLYRNNAKIQDYFNVITNFTGYYTVALLPDGVGVADGVPAGNGYLTLTIDNRGTVRVAGMLADGTTRPSVSVAACQLREDAASANGWALYVPVYIYKAPSVFGGEIRLVAKEGSASPVRSWDPVVDSTYPLIWNNDNPKLTYSGEEGWRLSLIPAGGWYDTIFNLQAHYLTRAFEIESPDVMEYPEESVAAGFNLVTDVQPAGYPISLAGDAFTTEKKTLVKAGKLYDLAASVNPCNIQVKLARATGIVTGTFSIWSEKEDGTQQKEITGLKHNGVVLLTRDDYAPITDEMVALGFFTQAVKVSDYNETTKRTTTRSWTFSAPFNLLGIDQGDIDWWADDWGEEP